MVDNAEGVFMCLGIACPHVLVVSGLVGDDSGSFKAGCWPGSLVCSSEVRPASSLSHVKALLERRQVEACGLRRVSPVKVLWISEPVSRGASVGRWD